MRLLIATIAVALAGVFASTAAATTPTLTGFRIFGGAYFTWRNVTTSRVFWVKNGSYDPAGLPNTGRLFVSYPAAGTYKVCEYRPVVVCSNTVTIR